MSSAAGSFLHVAFILATVVYLAGVLRFARLAVLWNAVLSVKHSVPRWLLDISGTILVVLWPLAVILAALIYLGGSRRNG